MNNVKIAFDLDGVLLPDHNKIPKLSEKEFFELTLYEKPLFSPIGLFDIVTARTESVRPITENWLKQLNTPPQNLFMREDKLIETPGEFKYRICRSHGYDMYIESDLEICKEMERLSIQNHYKFKIIHFATWVSGSFLSF